MFKLFKIKSLLRLTIFLSPVLSELLCRPEGPVVPRPVSLSSSPDFLSAARNLSDNFSPALNGTIRAGFPTENVSFSVAVVSLAQDDPRVPLWEHHHLSAANIDGTKELDRNSQYLIGSVSKVLSDAVLLKSGLSLDDSITKYLPELASSDSPVRWENISLGALASQLSGIPPNYGFSEFYYLKDYFESLGFPPLNDSDYAPCGVQALNMGCTREQFLQGMLQVRPVASPMTRPVYSNIVFSLFVFAIEAATGMNYTEQLKHYVTDPLGMMSTTTSPGVDDRAVIPPMQSSWGSHYGDNAPGGGLVSTISDLSTFFHAILSRNATLLPPTAINSWLKPRSPASSSHSSVGAPWEIFTPDAGTLTPDHPHTVHIYAKNGAAYGYNAQVALVDDYGVAVVVLTAGEPQAYRFVYDATLSSIVRAVDEAARVEADERGYTGSFEGPCSGVSGTPEPACLNVTA
ncbi:hypothetical protein INS49_000134 [Diaporthe citri]|uniref:uncharacterized protein n=1 Tax=Diaporthe citri TaxID=83186 RepID=UPI001C826365|nr:uncharacterized protein INS49_000134 [Diaporthe citri]KAG6365958.1 hypothetical protein INS49_000134 [Diaporthe citri]